MAENTAHKWHVFVSYSTKNTAFAELIVNDLRNQGLSIWFDRSVILGGERIRERINDGITHSGSIIVLISIHSLRSRWVLNELDSAMLREINSRRTVIIPILIGKVDVNQLPDDLKGKRFIDLRNNFARKYQKMRLELVSAIVSIIRSGTAVQFTDDEIFPLNADGVGRVVRAGNSDLILSVKDGEEGKYFTLKDVYDIFLETFQDDDFWKIFTRKDNYEEDMMKMSKFIDEYGRRAAAELIGFVITHSKITTLSPISDDDFIKLANDLQIVLMMFALQTKLEPFGFQIEMIAPKTEPHKLAFRFAP